MNEIVSATAGVLLAAGRGRRMGEPKQLLPWADSTVVAAAFDALSPHCGAGMVVVLGAEADRVMGALEQRAFQSVTSDPDAEQIDSARLGLRCAAGIPGTRRVLLHPADHPVVSPLVIEAMLGRAAQCNLALIPTYQGRGGHPVLIPVDVVESILSWRSTAGGLRAFWESHAERVERIEFPDAAGLVMDLDTPEGYAEAQRRHK